VVNKKFSKKTMFYFSFNERSADTNRYILYPPRLHIYNAGVETSAEMPFVNRCRAELILNWSEQIHTSLESKFSAVALRMGANNQLMVMEFKKDK
jgi:hypothetical protein